MRAKTVFLAIAGVLSMCLSYTSLIAFQDKTVWEGVYSEAQAVRGEAIFGEKCAKCHGSDMSGGDAPSLVGSEFSGNWDDLSLGDLAERLRVSMPQDAPQTLSREETADLVAAILRGNRVPAGQTELPSQAEYLKMIKYRATKP